MTTARNGAEEAEEAGRDGLLDEELTRTIIGSYFAVCRKLRAGCLEEVYKKALAIELRRAECQFQSEPLLHVHYDGVRIARYRPDFVVAGRVVVEAKATSALVDADKRQLINCLSCLELEVGLLFQFGPRPQFRRVIFSNSNKPMLRPVH